MRLRNGHLEQLRRLSGAEGIVYAAFAGALTLWVAVTFVSSLELQLFYSAVRPDPFLRYDDWSAPLDDVFIHFDFARAAARGHPFEWSEGNGYSSGGTSALYPFVLALGYVAGYRGGSLMHFAVIVACVSVLAALIGSRRLFRNLPRWTSYLAPPFFLGVGALSWSLVSGMEVAFFLAVWSGALVAWDDLVAGPPRPGARSPDPFRAAAILGAFNALLVATRPEAAVVVACFCLSAAWVLLAKRGPRTALGVVAISAVPGALVLVGQAVANRIFTGDFSAAGALVKLELHHPHLSSQAVWDAWLFHVKYQVARVTAYHVADNLWIGSLLWVLSAVPLFSRKTRSYALLLWASSLSWVLVTALNGQVRWQNERYTMPALAWMLLCASMGVGVLLTARPARGRRGLWLRSALAMSAVLVVSVLVWRQAPKFRGQVWFFGRAARNIRDQHIRAARKISQLTPVPRRVLVGDAGAIPYETDLPALDIIGLGGYFDLPFARASRWGVASAVELIERMPPWERPDLLAIYPSWWGAFPLWFGRRIEGVSVRGNVICGGATKVLYAADWGPLDGASVPFGLAAGRVIDSLDFGDVVSERDHAFDIDGAVGFVTMKLLPHPERRGRRLWDAGRALPPGASMRFELDPKGAPLDSIAFRVAPSQPSTLRVWVAGSALEPVALEPVDVWEQVAVSLAGAPAERPLEVRLSVERHELVLYHLWGLGSP